MNRVVLLVIVTVGLILILSNNGYIPQLDNIFPYKLVPIEQQKERPKALTHKREMKREQQDQLLDNISQVDLGSLEDVNTYETNGSGDDSLLNTEDY